MLDNVLSETIVPRPKSFPTRLIAHPLWLSLSADIFTGQMIASLIVLTFVAVFLLREWISQNARPGVFEEEEAPPDEPPLARPPLNPQPAPLQQPQLPGQQHQGAARPQPQGPTPVPLPQDQLDTTQTVNAPQAGFIDPDPWFAPQTPPIQDERQKKKSRAWHSDTDDDEQSSLRPRVLDSEEASPQQKELFKRKMFHRRIHVARTTTPRRRGFTLQKSSSSAPLTMSEQKAKFHFTFKAPSASLVPGESSNAVKPSVASGPMDASPFPSVALQPPSADIPFSLRRWQQTAHNESESSVSQPYPPRPSLPAATRPQSSNSQSLFSAGTSTDSSSLAIYHPPEELQAEAGPSNPTIYLNQRKEYFDDDMDQEFEVVGEESEEEYTFGRLGAEHGRYFRDPDDTDSDEEEIPGLGPLQESLNDSDSEEDIRQGDVNDNDQARRHEDEDPAAADEEEEDDDGFHEGEDEDEELDPGEELFGQWDENGAEEEAIGPQAPPVGAAPGAFARGDQVGGAAPAAVADIEEGNVEDDMEGAMEGWSCSCGLLEITKRDIFPAIGMRGPIYGVFQNVCFFLLMSSVSPFPYM